MRLDIPDSPPLDLSLLLQAAASALTPCTLPVLSARPSHMGWLLGTELAAGTCAPLPPLGNGVHTRGRVPACCPGPRGLCLRTWPCSKHADSLSTPKPPTPPPAATRVWPTPWDEDLRTTPDPAPGWQEPPSLVFPAGTCPAWELPGDFSPAPTPSPTPNNLMKQIPRDVVLLSMFCKVPEGNLGAGVSRQVKWPAGRALRGAAWPACARRGSLGKDGCAHPFSLPFRPRFIIKSSRTLSLGTSCSCM